MELLGFMMYKCHMTLVQHTFVTGSILLILSMERNCHSICHVEGHRPLGDKQNSSERFFRSLQSPPAEHVTGGENMSSDHKYKKLVVNSLIILNEFFSFTITTSGFTNYITNVYIMFM